MRYAKVSHVMYQAYFISDMLNINYSKSQKTANANDSKHQYLQVSIILEIRNVKFQ